jgi:cytochrome c553
VRKIGLTALGLAVLVGLFMLRRSPTAARQTTGAADQIDAVARLQQRIDNGAVTLTFDARTGYLSSLLTNLNIPLSSQVLILSKSSAQMSGISPARPRAVYFNDEAYVGWVQEGGLELAAVDPKGGPFFYTLTQEENPHPKLERHTTTCVGCHDSSDDPAKLIPRLLMLSVLPDRDGRAIGAAALATTDRSPLRERWGGWYVTGTHGRQTHMGNQTFLPPAGDLTTIPDFIKDLDLSRGSNVTDLTNRFDTKPYLRATSDIVALMVLGHQSHVHNLMAVAVYKVQDALAGQPKDADINALVKELGEPVVRAMLFSGEAPLTDPVAGTSGFADDFMKPGPRDSRGRSLRDLDLKTRLLRYPLSYVIYSDSFDQMPAVLKDYIYRRLREVLSGADKSPAYAHLSASDREAIVAILRDTKPEVF